MAQSAQSEKELYLGKLPGDAEELPTGKERCTLGSVGDRPRKGPVYPTLISRENTGSL